MFAKGKKSVKNSLKSGGLTGFESLEARELLAANLVASLNGKELRIEGTEKADVITLRLSSNSFSLDNLKIKTAAGLFSSVAASKVTSIRVDALGGSDTIDLRASTKVGATVLAGGGWDSVVGTATADTIWGEAEGDKIWGMGGADTLYGEGGIDELIGGDGNDKLYGGDQIDDLFGNAGDDDLYGGGGNDDLVGGSGKDLFVGGDGFDNFWDDFNLSKPSSTSGRASEVFQAESGTCVINATMAGTAEVISYSDKVRYVGNNQFDVRLYKNGNLFWERVNFNGGWNDNDSRPTVDAKGRNTGDFWSTVTQRAFLESLNIDWTKDEDSWPTTNYRDKELAIERLTGWDAKYFNPATVDLKTLKSTLDAKGVIVVGGYGEGTKKANTASGIVSNHAYTVLKVDVAAKTVTLRNPWGSDGNNGAIQGTNDGVFTVSLATFQGFGNGYHAR